MSLAPDLTPDSNIMFVGDTHGDLGFIGYVLSEAERFQCELVIQLGDFGFWPHTRDGLRFLELVNRYLDVPFAFCAGNHDNWWRLDSLPVRDDGLVDIGTHVTYVPRGARFELAGTSFLGIGGAYSIDKEWRLHRMRQEAEYRGRVREQDEIWWSGEMVTEADVKTCVDGGEVDVVIAHDTPTSVSLEHHFVVAGGRFFKGDKQTVINRRRLQKVLEGCRPKHWINGHYHVPYHETLVMDGGWLCRVRGLGANVPHEGTQWEPQGAWWISTPRELRGGSADS